METLFRAKVEDINMPCVKNEEYADQEQYTKPVKKEEEEEKMTEASNHSLDNVALLRQTEERYELLVATLNQYLQNFIDVEDFELPPRFQKDKEVEEMVLEAKSDFRKSCGEIIVSLTDDLRKKGVQHTLPDTYLVRVVETTKRRIFSSYKHLKRNFIETLTHIKDNSANKEKDTKPKKNIRKNKYDFPAEAQSLLRAWFVANAHDPYPSHEEKIQLARRGGISMKQLDNWLTNTRGRIWKQTKKSEPRFEKQIASMLGAKNQDFLKIPFC